MTSTSKPAWTPNPLYEPAQPGNELALKHGAYSPKKTDERGREIVAQLVLAGGSVAYLAAPEYSAAVWRYAQRQARADLLHEHLLAHGETCTGCDRCLSWEERWRTFDLQAEKAAVQLGLTPLSRARLGRDVATGKAADAAAELTRMREEWERAGRTSGVKVDDEGELVAESQDVGDSDA